MLALDLFSPAWAALVTTCSYGSSLLLGFPAGVLADRMSRRRIMMVAELVQFLAMTALCLTLWFDAATLALLCVVSCVNGGMHAVFSAASTSSIPDLVPRKLLASALSANEARNAALSIIGPIAGAGLLGPRHWRQSGSKPRSGQRHWSWWPSPLVWLRPQWHWC